MNLRTLVPFLCAALAVPFVTGPLAAAEPGTPVLIAGYWAGFLDHWSEVFRQQNGIVMGTLVLGALCLFIITRGKWKK